jgi:uncharacterized protein YecT (DUF1311 family)
MLALALLAGGWLALASPRPAESTATETPGPTALDACQQLATRQFQQASPGSSVSIRLLEEDTKEEKVQARVGSQSIATVLTGRGVWQDKSDGSSNVRFTCLLASSAEPLFVHVVADGRRDPVDVCWDGFEAAEWEKVTQCLRDALRHEEAALAESVTAATRQAEQSMDPLSAKKTLQASSAEWVKFRDLECDRRQAAVAGRNHPDIGELICRIHMTAARIAELHLDE